MVNFMCQLGWATVPKSLLQREGVFVREQRLHQCRLRKAACPPYRQVKA